MKIWLKRIGFGVILWAVAYTVAIPLLPLQENNMLVFKALIVTFAVILTTMLAVAYFLGVERRYLRESFLVAATWVIVNWLLDFVALLPFTGQSVPQYFLQIGIEYLGGAALVIGIGYLLEKKLANNQH